MFRLETERLIIRPWRDDDRPGFLAIMRHPEVTRFVHGGIPYTDADADEFLARHTRQVAQHGLCMGATLDKTSGRLLGIAGAQPLGDDIEIGWIFARDTWGRGYATEAGAAAMKHVLDTLGRPRVIAIIDPENLPSKRVAARLGMAYEGLRTGAQLGHRKPEIVVDLYVRRAGPPTGP